VKISGHERIVLTDAEFTIARNWCLGGIEGDYRVYANTDTNLWSLIGPGVDYPIPSGKGATFESIYGPHVAQTDAFLNDLRAGLKGTVAGVDINGIVTALKAAGVTATAA
jgi:hypothetical protein